MKKFLFCAAVFLSAWTLGARTTVMPFVRIDRNPATAAMAGAGIAAPVSPAMAVFGNPAALPFSGSDIAVSWQNWSPGGLRTTQFNIGGGFKMSETVGITLGGAWQGHGAMDSYTADGTPIGTFTPTDILIGGGFGVAFSPYFSLGANGRYLQQRMDSESAISTFSGDLFLLYRKNALAVTAGISSLGPEIKDGDQAYTLPASATGGAAYDFTVGKGQQLRVALDGDYFFNGGISGALGLQYAYQQMVFLRAGFHGASSLAPLPTYGSLGAGIRFSGFHLDVSWLIANSVLGNTFSVAIGYCF